MLREPPHYLRGVTTTTTPKRLMWLAAHGTAHKRRDHYEHMFNAGALGTTHWTARKHVRKDKMFTFNDPEALWVTVDMLCPVGRRVVMFAYDLAEQMRLSQMLTYLPAFGWTLDKIVLERTAAWALLRKGKLSLLCCDVKAWCPVTFEKLASDVRITNDISNEISAGAGYRVDMCKYRVAIVRESVLQILNFIEGENLGPFKPTGSGQSYSAFRRRFLGERLLVHDDEHRLTVERKAMATGRAEAWRHGELRSGPYVEYDLHAAYATIGRDCEVPSVARPGVARPPLARLERMLDRYAVLADVTVTTRNECVPLTMDGRTMWPVGTFRTQLWDPELRLALELCESVRVHEAWPYTRTPVLHDFCKYVLEGMEGQTMVYGLTPQRVLKHWSRCLVGRLGLRYRAWHKFGEQVPPDVRLVTYLDVDEGTRTEMLLAGSQRLLLGDMTESLESLPQVPGWIMSECRRRLWDAMAGVGFDRIVYVDTDSVIIAMRGLRQQDLRVPPSVATGWIRKGSYPSMTIYGPRNLCVGPDRRVSGLPLSARQLAPLEFSGEVMRSVKQSMRQGELDRVVTMPREFHLKPVDLRREHNADGSTSPYVITQQEG